ncbi:MAG: insulinase family protein [Lachnospirales bacterium]
MFHQIQDNEKLTIYKWKINGPSVIFLKSEDDIESFVCALKNDDYDNRGLPHILEHMLYGGSKKYDYNDTFLHMEENFSYTYLNAITYKNLTTFLCSSKNHNDFFEMVDIHLDFIFSPLLKKEKFSQEIYSQSEKTGALYNEMLSLYKDSDYIFENSFLSYIIDDYKKFNPHGIPTDIENVTINDVCEYYENILQSKNLFFVFHGIKNTALFLEKLSGFLNKESLHNFEKVSYIIEKNHIKSYFEDVFYFKIKYDNYEDLANIELGVEYLNSVLTKKDIFNNIKTYKYDNFILIYFKVDEAQNKEKIIDTFFEKINNKKEVDNFVNRKKFFILNGDYGYKTEGIHLGIKYSENYFLNEKIEYIDELKNILSFSNKSFLNIIKKHLIECVLIKKNIKNEECDCYFLDKINSFFDGETVYKNDYVKNAVKNNVKDSIFEQNSFFSIKDYHFYEKSDIIVLICHESYDYSSETMKNEIIFHSFIKTFIVKSMENYKYLVDFKCEPVVSNDKLYIKNYMVGTKEQVSYFFDFYKKNSYFEFNHNEFYNFIKNTKDIAILKYIYKENINYMLETTQIVPFCNEYFICSNKDDADILKFMFEKFIAELKLKSCDILIDDLKLEDDYVTHNLILSKTPYSFIMMIILRYELLLKKIRFGEISYCYNVSLYFDFFENEISFYFVFEHCDVSFCSKLMKEVHLILDDFCIDEVTFEKYKKISLKTFEKHNPFYRKFSLNCDDMFFKSEIEKFKEILSNFSYFDFKNKNMGK